MLLSERLAQVYAGPEGPQVAAFFDLEGTVLHRFSAVELSLDLVRSGGLRPLEAIRSTTMAVRGVDTADEPGSDIGSDIGSDMGSDNGSGTGSDIGDDDATTSGERVYAKMLASRVYPEAWHLVQAHHRMGHTLVLASSATRFQVEAAARTLGIDDVLTTARAEGPTLGRPGRAEAVRELAATHDLDLLASYAYANGEEDIDFLSQVGHPAATTPEDRLRQYAIAAGWPVLEFRSRGLPGLPTIARSAAAFGGVLTGIGTGAALGLLNRSRRTAISSMTALSAEFSLALAGVRVETVGEQHVWEQRPAVFVFNHQSQLDVFVICYLLRHDVTGLVRRELTQDPILGPVLRFAGLAFVDQKPGAKPRDALAPAVAKLQDGISVAIAPERNRSFTPMLGEFETGAFHLAREAGVPVVPIVIRNSAELMWRDALTVKPGTVQVAALPPIDASAWPADQVRNKVREVEALFAETLAHWPGDARPADG